LTFQIKDFLHELHELEESEKTERVGFVNGLDLIRLQKKLRKNGVRR
jgi:hypothetical protein